MIKKIPLWLIISVMLLELCVPVGMIVYEKETENIFLEKAQEYKIKVELNIITSGTVSYDFPTYPFGKNVYAAVLSAEDGFSELSPAASKPKGNAYIYSKNGAEEAMYSYELSKDYTYYFNAFSNRDKSYSAYITIKIYNGDYLVSGVYIDDIPIEEWLAQNNAHLPL